MPSPNLIDRRVRLEAADHVYAGESGVVIYQAPDSQVDWDWLLVRLDSGKLTLVFEPEALPEEE